MATTGFNIVRFNCNGASVAVEFESGFKFEAGLKPDVNVARVSYVELNKLGGNYAQPGSLVFSFSGAGAADVTIANISIVDLQPARVETVLGSGGPIVMEWNIHFADFRWGYVAPRGGRLRYGVVNPSNPQPADSEDDGSDTPPNGITGTPVKVSVLMQNCLSAMGSNATINGDADSASPPADLQWHGSHAPAELQKLMDHCGMAFCPHLDGSASIETIGQGSPPTIPAGRQIATVDCGQIDIRGTTVVIFSAPTPVIVTETITGPSSDTWEFVVQDLDGTWQPVYSDSGGPSQPDNYDAPEVLQGFDPVDLIVQSFSQLDNPDPTLMSQLYFCVRLNTDKYPAPLMPILTQRFDTGGVVGRPQIQGNVSILPQDQAQLPKNFTQANCNAVLTSDQTILHSDIRLGKLGGTAKKRSDYDALFQPLTDGDLSIRFSHEKLDDNFQPCYYIATFTSDGGGGAARTGGGTDAGSQSVLNSPNASTVFVCQPDYQCLEIDGNSNQDTLDSQAQEIAPPYLIDTSAQTTETRAVGFVAADLNGLISKIEFQQKHPTTTFYLNHWHRPHTKHARHLHHRQERAHGVHDDYPKQKEQLMKRATAGMSGSSPANHPHGTKTSQPDFGSIFIGKVTKDGGTDGTQTTAATWTYTLKSVDGQTTIGTTLTPVKQRSPLGSVFAGNGYVFYILDDNGKPVILDALEQINTGPCGS